MIPASGAAPVTSSVPWLLPSAAAAMPATWVPWLVASGSEPIGGAGVGSSSEDTKSRPPATRLAARSAIEKSTPVSTTAIGVAARPVLTSHAAGNRPSTPAVPRSLKMNWPTFARPHCHVPLVGSAIAALARASTCAHATPSLSLRLATAAAAVPSATVTAVVPSRPGSVRVPDAWTSRNASARSEASASGPNATTTRSGAPSRMPGAATAGAAVDRASRAASAQAAAPAGERNVTSVPSAASVAYLSALADQRSAAAQGAGACLGRRRALGRARLVAEHELALDRARLVSPLGAPVPDVVRAEVPGVRVVRQRALERIEQVVAQRRVLDRRHQLDPRVEVARHEVGRADVDLGLAVALEGQDPRVLEEAADDRVDADVLRDARHARHQAADAADVQVDGHAGLRGAVQRADAAPVDQRVELHRDARRPPSLVRGHRALDLGDHRVAQEVGRHQLLAVAPRASVAGEEVEHVGDVGTDLLVAGEEAEVGVQARRLRVVVAGPDVDVMARAVALAADDQQALGVGLERRVTVDDVDARLLHRARPLDVRPLVAARLDLDQADRLLAALGGADERGHERRVVARAVDGHLDGQDLGVVGRLLDEALDRRRERVVGVVDQHVAGADGAEDVDVAVVLALKARLRHGRPRRVAQIGVAGQLDDLPQVREIQQPVDDVDLARLDLERLDELVAQRLAHLAVDLETHDLAEPAPAQLGLDRAQQVVGLVGDVEVGVARDAEEAVVDDLHPGEERVEVGGDELLERDEGGALARGDEARQQLLGHLAAREGRHLRLRVAHEDGERQRQVRDVGERAPQTDRQRREDREDLAPEALVERLALVGADLVHADDADVVLGQGRAHLVLRAARLALVELEDALAQLVDDLRRRAPVGTGVVQPGVDLVVQPGDADGEELVEVGGEDGEELQALHERHVVLLGQLEHARVELDPRELAVVEQPRAVEVAGVALELELELWIGRRDVADRVLLSHRRRSGRLGRPTRGRRCQTVKAASAPRAARRSRSAGARGSPRARARATARGSARRAVLGALRRRCTASPGRATPPRRA